MTIDPAVTKHLRGMLKPQREHYPLAAVLVRLVAILTDDVALDEVYFDEASGQVYVVRDEVATEKPGYVVKDGVVTVKPGIVVWAGEGDPIKALIKTRGRPRADCYLTLLLAVIFHEYTGKSPTRLWNKGKKWERSHFYKFADAAFRRLFGINRPPLSAFREVCELWKQLQPRDFSNMRRRLFDNL